MTFSVPIRSLGIDRPGVYPLLININGTPEDESPSRLDEARFLLPVTGVPVDPAGFSDNPLPTAPDTTSPCR